MALENLCMMGDSNSEPKKVMRSYWTLYQLSYRATDDKTGELGRMHASCFAEAVEGKGGEAADSGIRPSLGFMGLCPTTHSWQEGHSIKPDMVPAAPLFQK